MVYLVNGLIVMGTRKGGLWCTSLLREAFECTELTCIGKPAEEVWVLRDPGSSGKCTSCLFGKVFSCESIIKFKNIKSNNNN